MQVSSLITQKVLSPTQITLADYVINTYRGCEFGCLYCYSQTNKNIKRNEFFSCLSVKSNAPQILEKELKYCRPKRILLGSTTECFQYQEKKENVTKEVISILNAHKIPYTILTKSPLIADYLDIIAKNKENKIYFTFNFACDKLIRLMEKKSPPLAERIRAIKEITHAGVGLRLHIGPCIPYLTNLEEILNLTPTGVKEIDIELYHKKQGNFKRIVEAIKRNISPEVAFNIQDVYKSRNSYDAFTKQLEGDIHKYKRIYPFKFFYLVPEFDNFYSPCFDYEKTVF